MPICRGGASRMILVVKASREIAQTARLRREFRFYLAPVHVGGVATYGLLTAFFDDYDEPLIIRTPLFNDEITRDFRLLLSSDSFYVHFFDKHDRELLGFRAKNLDAHRFRAFSNSMRFAPPTLARAPQIDDGLQAWFGTRSPTDDDAAFTIHLRERLFPDSLAEHVANPGNLNESDIATSLHRPFGGAHVFKNPIRADSKREFVDVLVATPDTLLLIQAKDSPSTESALTRKIERIEGYCCQTCQECGRPIEGVHQCTFDLTSPLRSSPRGSTVRCPCPGTMSSGSSSSRNCLTMSD